MRRCFVVVLLVGVLAGSAGCASVSTVTGSGNRAEAVRKYNYAGKEEFLEVEGATITPDMVAPGQVVQAAVRYVVLAPDVTKQVMVVESRTLVGGSDSLLLSKREVTQEQGSHASTLKFTVPNDMTKGSYTLVTSITVGNQTKTVRRAFGIN